MIFLKQLHADNEPEHGKKFLRFDRELDGANHGPMWLKNPQLASIVVAAMNRVSHKEWCVVHASVIMPNHVHLLVEPAVELRQITRAIKGSSACACNEILRRTGQPFWQQESYDHWVRSPASFEKIRLYIERNPVSARLVKSPEDWEWSSAGK